MIIYSIYLVSLQLDNYLNCLTSVTCIIVEGLSTSGQWSRSGSSVLSSLTSISQLISLCITEINTLLTTVSETDIIMCGKGYTFMIICSRAAIRIYYRCLQQQPNFFNPYRTELVFHNSSHFQHWQLHCRYMYLDHHSLSILQNLTPFPTWNTTSSILLTVTQMSPSASQDLFKCSVLPVLTATGANKMTPPHCMLAPATNQIAWAVRWLHPL